MNSHCKRVIGLAVCLFVSLVAGASPEILESPQSQSLIPLGTNLTLTVTALGENTLTFHWKHNGESIAGATNASFTITNFQIADCGSYRVSVSDGDDDSVLSDRAELGADLPSLLLQDNFSDRVLSLAPTGIGMANNSEASVETGEPRHANRRGGRSLWYSWLAPANGIASFSTAGSSFDTLLAVYRGTNLTTLSLVAGDDDSGGYLTSALTFNAVAGTTYQIAVDGRAKASGNLILSWNFEPTSEEIPQITLSPISQTVLPGTDLYLSVAFTGDGDPEGHWWFNDHDLQTTNNTLLVRGVSENNVGKYRVHVRPTRWVKDRDVVTTPADIQINTAGERSGAFDKFSDTSDAAHAVSSLQLLLQFPGLNTGGGGPASGYTSTQIFNTYASTKEPGEPDHCGVPGGASEWFAYQAPTNGLLTLSTEGSSFDTVLAVYTGPGTDFASLVPVACDNDSGADGRTSLLSFQATAGTTYYIVVDGVNGATGIVKLHYTLGDPPMMTLQPQPQSTPAGANVLFSTAAVGTQPLKFQWRLNNAPLHNATNALLPIANVSLAASGDYSVIVSNYAGSVTSQVASLSVFNQASSRVRFHTAAGNIDVDLFDSVKPLTVANFLRYIESGAYQGTLLHRFIPGFVLQGGGYQANPLAGDFFANCGAIPSFDPVPNEFETGSIIHNFEGTLAMANIDGAPDSATSQWFFNLGDNSANLDSQNGGYTVFGRIVDGMDVIQAIAALSLSNGIVDLTGYYGTAAAAFDSLPLLEANPGPPGAADLFYVDISILRTPTNDFSAPMVSFSIPTGIQKTTNASIVLHGTARDNLRVSQLFYSLNGGALQEADGTTNWTIAATLVPGTNVITVQAVDLAGNASFAGTRTFFYSVTSPFTLAISGRGTVSPNLDGASLEIGRGYRLQASPLPGYVFTNWSGDINSTSPVINLFMRSNMTVTANFIPNPFIGHAGIYYGLFYETNSLSHQSSGALSLYLTERGSFTARLRIEGISYSFVGALDLSGAGSKTILRAGKPPLEITLAVPLQPGANELSGTVQTDDWTSTLAAHRSVFNALANPATAFAGTYTVVLPADPTPGAPEGHGLASVRIDNSGLVRAFGSMGDGTVWTRVAPLSSEGDWPFYLSLYNGKGSALGWLAVATNAPRRISGQMAWIKTSIPEARFNPDGFTNLIALTSSEYRPETLGQDLFDGSILNLVLSCNGISGPVTNQVAFLSNNTFSILEPNPGHVTFRFNLTTGLIYGSGPLLDGANRTWKAVFLQDQKSAAGCFSGPLFNGSVQLGP